MKRLKSRRTVEMKMNLGKDNKWENQKPSDFEGIFKQKIKFSFSASPLPRHSLLINAQRN